MSYGYGNSINLCDTLTHGVLPGRHVPLV